jgi:hypothetical protein
LRRILYPNIAEAYYNRGTAKFKLGLNESAEDDQRKEVELGFIV